MRVLLLAIFLFAFGAQGGEGPTLIGFVTDQAGIIPAEIKEQLEGALGEVQKSSGDEIRVLCVSDLGDQSIEIFSKEVFAGWKPASENPEEDKRALFVVATGNRKMRLEVGSGLAPVLTQAMVAKILGEVVRPYFKDGDFGGGILAGVREMITVLEINVVVAKPEDLDMAVNKVFSFLTWIAYVVILLIGLKLLSLMFVSAKSIAQESSGENSANRGGASGRW